MNPQVVVNSLAVKNNKEANFNFVKYDIEVSIEEIENKDTKSKLEFVITLLSEPKNVRLSIDGHVEISGNEAERAIFLEKDENNIPQVLHLIYKELFPLFFMLTKSVGVPCPAYRLSQISAPTEGQKIDDSEPQTIETPQPEAKPEPQTIETPQPEASNSPSEMNFESKTTEELTTLHGKLSNDYQTNPSDNLRNEIGKIHAIIQKRSQQDVVAKPA